MFPYIVEKNCRGDDEYRQGLFNGSGGRRLGNVVQYNFSSSTEIRPIALLSNFITWQY